MILILNKFGVMAANENMTYRQNIVPFSYKNMSVFIHDL